MAPCTTILLIDPHADDRAYWKHRLQACSPDYTIHEAETGEKGLEIWSTHQIDCVLLELTLPDMSGFEVLIKLIPRARFPDVAVLILTRLVLHPMVDLALNSGAQAYLVKSRCSGDELEQAITKAVALVGPNKRRHTES
jgi:DNA-binding NarL/FixJ family response regulator